MKAQISRDSLGNIHVRMEGGFDYEYSKPLHDELSLLVKKNPTSKITLDFHAVDFVGSSGIGVFVETLKILKDQNNNISLSNLKPEFVKVFKLYNFTNIEGLIQEFESDETEDLNIEFGARKRTFEN